MDGKPSFSCFLCSYNQEPGQYSDNEPDHQGREELTLQPLRLEAATDLDEADEVEPLVVGSPDSALTETVWLSPTSEDLVPEAAADLHLLQQRQQDQQPLRHHQQRLNHFGMFVRIVERAFRKYLIQSQVPDDTTEKNLLFLGVYLCSWSIFWRPRKNI